MRALIVDDERVARAAVAMALAQHGFDCYHAEDGEEAFQRVMQEPFDLVVTDLRMPRANGHEFEVLLFTEPKHQVWLRSVTRLAPLPVSHAWVAECCRFEEPILA